MTPTSPRRRWYQFGLRTMFVAVGILAAFLAYYANWIRQRHAALMTHRSFEGRLTEVDAGIGVTVRFRVTREEIPAPSWPLRLMGEKGVGIIYVGPAPVDTQHPFETTEAEREEIRRLEQLFPEASVARTPPSGTEYSP